MNAGIHPTSNHTNLILSNLLDFVARLPRFIRTYVSDQWTVEFVILPFVLWNANLVGGRELRCCPLEGNLHKKNPVQERRNSKYPGMKDSFCNGRFESYLISQSFSLKVITTTDQSFYPEH